MNWKFSSARSFAFRLTFSRGYPDGGFVAFFPLAQKEIPEYSWSCIRASSDFFYKIGSCFNIVGENPKELFQDSPKLACRSRTTQPGVPHFSFFAMDFFLLLVVRKSFFRLIIFLTYYLSKWAKFGKKYFKRQSWHHRKPKKCRFFKGFPAFYRHNSHP